MPLREKPTGLGTVLDNGATVIDVTWQTENIGVCLCVWADSPDPFVTWTITNTEKGLVVWTGHYYSDIGEAVADYYRRGGLNRSHTATLESVVE